MGKKQSTMMMIESLLDIPRKTLDPEVFELDGDKPQLKSSVRDEIMRQADVYAKWGSIKRVLLIGSMLTKHWKESSDLDVTLLMKPNSAEAFDEAKKYSVDHQDTNTLPGTEHPLNYYIRTNIPVGGWDDIYDVTGNGWTVKSDIAPKGPEVYLHQFDSLIKHIDIEAGELYRDLVDYNELLKYDEDDVEGLHQKVEIKSKEIDDQVHELVSMYKTVRSFRASVFNRPLTPEEVREYRSKNLLPVAVLYKLLERYHYLKLLKELEKVLKKASGCIDTKQDVKNVQKALEKSDVVEELITELTTAAAAGPYEVPLGATPAGRHKRRKRRSLLLMPGMMFLHGITK